MLCKIHTFSRTRKVREVCKTGLNFNPQTSMVNQCMSHSWWWQQLVRNRTNLILAVRSFVRVAERTAIGTDRVTHSRIFKELPVSCEHGELRGPMEVAWVVAVVVAWAAFCCSGASFAVAIANFMWTLCFRVVCKQGSSAYLPIKRSHQMSVCIIR